MSGLQVITLVCLVGVVVCNCLTIYYLRRATRAQRRTREILRGMGGPR